MPASQPDNASNAMALEDIGSYQDALNRAQQQSSPKQAAPYYLMAAQSLASQGKFEQALEILQTHVVKVEFKGRFEGLLLLAQSGAELDQPNIALEALRQAERMPMAERPKERIALLNVRADVMGKLDNWTNAVRDRSQLSVILPQEQLLENQTKLWQAVQNLTDNEVRRLQSSDLPLLGGWLSVSNILRQQNLSVEQQVAAFEQWRNRHPSHPAAITPPLDIQIMSTLKQQEPKAIAILLPMTKELKPASDAILDGLMKSHFAASEQRPELHVIDTDRYPDFADAYQAALDSGAETILGPLRKQNVARLGDLVDDVPTIALNQLETNNVVENLYHFSLNVSDDIRELMSFAKQEGASNAAVLAIDSTWGARQSDQFNTIADHRELPVLTSLSYENTPNGRQQAVKRLLQVDESEARIQTIRRWTKQSVESTPRARQDLDYVYFVGKLDDAKQIRPLMDFYFAEDIPMLAAQTIHDRTPSPNTKDEDIERIVFTEIPAVTNQEDANLPFVLQRLDALGNDSYLIAKRLPLFTHVKSAKVSAKTGIITLDDDGIFNRRPNIVTYKQGALIDAKEDYFKHTEN